MKTLFLTASAIAAASLLSPAAMAAPKDKKAKPTETTAPAGGPEMAEDAPMNDNAATPATPAIPASGGERATRATPATPSPSSNAERATPATPATPSDGTGPATPATPATPPQTAAAPTDPAGILRNEFPSFDADKSGELSNAEFTTWLTALRQNSPGQPLTPEQQTAWITQSFAQADTSKNGAVALDELTKFLVKG